MGFTCSYMRVSLVEAISVRSTAFLGCGVVDCRVLGLVSDLNGISARFSFSAVFGAVS